MYLNSKHLVLAPSIILTCTYMFIYTGQLPEDIYKVLEFGIIFIFVLMNINKGSQMKLPGIKLLIIFIIYCLSISVVLNSGITPALLFLYNLIPYVLLYYITINLFISKEEIYSFERIIFFILGFQIFAAVIKLFTFGQNEIPVFLVGSDLTTYVFFIVAGHFFIKYRASKNPKYLFYIIMSLIIPLAGSKRAPVFIFPLIILILSFSKRISLSLIIFVIITIILSTFLLVTVIPTLNPEGKVGGSFDLDYLLWYANFYTNATDGYNPNLAIGRTSAINNVYNVLSEMGISSILLGIGPGSILKSGFSGLNSADTITTLFNVKYGTNSLIFFVVQSGIIGTLIWFRFILVLIGSISDKFSSYKKLLVFIFIPFALFYSTVYKLDVIISIFYLLIALFYVKSNLIRSTQK